MKKIITWFGLLIGTFGFFSSSAEAADLSTKMIEEGLKPFYTIPFLPAPFYNVEKWLDVLTVEAEEKGALLGKKIVLDAGHGGKDSGAIVPNLQEKQVNLPITLKTAKRLEVLGAEVYLTRADDVTLQRKERYLLAEQVGADIFISVHANSGDADVSGLETFYHHDRDKELAETLQVHVVNETKSKSRGVRFGDYYVLRENTVPSALIETGFLTNQEESIKLASDAFHESIANGIVRGVLDYFD